MVKASSARTWIVQRNEGRIAQIDASQITSGTLSAERIPDLSADKITSGNLSAHRLPNLHASKITAGVFDAERIPYLSADKITSGVFNAGRIPYLSASWITAGVFSAERIPDLSADKITSGVFSADRIPHNKILYNDDHDFLSEGDFYPSNFEFENGSTYALEIELAGGNETVIFTFAPAASGNVRVSFVSLNNVAGATTRLDAGFLTVYADRIAMGSTAGIALYHDNDNINRYTLDRLNLKRVIKLR